MINEYAIFNEFIEACQMGDSDTVKSLLSKVDPSNMNNLAIRSACEDGREDVVKILLDDNRVDPTDQTNYAIRWASTNGHKKVVKLLLADNRVDPSDACNYAIRWACKHGHSEVVRMLMRNERVNPKGEMWLCLKDYDGYDEYMNKKECNYADLVIFEDIKTICYVENGDVDSIDDEITKERFIQWQYRIGGDKWAEARKCLKV